MKNIYIVTPSWLMTNRKEFARGVRQIEKLGFNVLNGKFPATLPSAAGKAAELHKAYLNGKVDVVLAQRGGYSSMQALPFVDFNLIKKHPKLLAGFSDLSTLLNSVYERTGIRTLHAPMVINLTDPTSFTVRSFMNALNGFPDKELFRGAPVKVYRPGRAAGTLKGGNLVTLSALFGTEWEIKTDNSIIFLEDVDEKPHEVDRYLTQWVLAGKFKKVKALILGDFRGVNNAAAWKVISGQMKVAFPVVHCPYIGHVKNKITLPVGERVELDTGKKTLVIK